MEWQIFLLCLALASASKFVDGPVQLIAPDPLHRTLILNPAGLELLASITEPVAAVSVVGPLHSGKSYLSNQLLHRTNGFTLGPSVRPQTRGLWMWGRPLYKTDENGNKIAIIFLDSEGLFSSDASEEYDAKIFAVSSLLSSMLIYNSVRFIDQSSIDYIELLSRRAQLFSVLSSVRENQTKVPKVTFPPLLWVVQNFFQDTEESTPTQWLHKILKSENHKTGKPSALPEIFEDIICHTLFYPEADELKLRYLDRVPEDELSPEYREQMSGLRDFVLKRVAPKQRGDMKITGVLLSVLLKSLVTGANVGNFPSVPSVWDGFIKIAIFDAKKKCLQYIQTQSESKFENDTFDEHQVPQMFDEIKEHGISVFSQLTLGVEEAKATIPEIEKEIKKLRMRFSDKNLMKLKEIFRKENAKLLSDFNQKKIENNIPMPSTQLEALKKETYGWLSQSFQDDLSRYSASSFFEHSLTKLQQDIDGEFARIQIVNEEKINQKLDDAIDRAVHYCAEFLRDEKEPLTVVGVNQVKAKAQEKAKSKFVKEAGFATQEKAFKGYESKLSIQLKEVGQAFIDRNEGLVFQAISKGTELLVEELLKEMDGIKVPQTSTKIVENAALRFEQILREYNQRFDKFDGTNAFSYHVDLLNHRYEEELALLQIKNQNHLKQYHTALGSTKDRLAVDVEHYYLEFTFKKHAVAVVKDAVSQFFSEDEQLAEEAAQVIVSDPNIIQKKFLIMNWHLLGFVSVVVGLVGAFFIKDRI